MSLDKLVKIKDDPHVRPGTMDASQLALCYISCKNEGGLDLKSGSDSIALFKVCF